MTARPPSRWFVAAAAVCAVASAVCAIAVAAPLLEPPPAPRAVSPAIAAPRTVVQVPVVVTTAPPAAPAPRRCEIDVELRFSYNRTTPPADMIASLAPVLEAARAHPEATIVVDGHADASGDAYQNLLLSKARSHGVAKQLAAAGVTNRITERAFGEFVPTEAVGLADQRRVRVSIREPNCTSEEQP